MATINHRDLEQAELHDPKYHASSHGAAGTDPLTAHSTWVVTDGTHPFTSTVAGITPTADAHLATKGYVDEQIGGIDTFLELNDTPSSYTGSEASGVRVNAEGTALEFYDISPYTDPDTLQIVTDRGATTSNSITTAGLTTAGTVQAEQLTSTDDVTLTGDIIVTSSGVSNIGTVSVSVNDAYIDQVYLKANPTLPLQATTKSYVDTEIASAVVTENLWDRAGTTLTTHNASDAIQMDGPVDWAAGNVTYVPIDGDIEAYVTAATAGDTLILAAGTYTLSSDIDISKQINIVGQGIGATIIAGSTLYAFDLAAGSSNTRIANLSITSTTIGTGINCASELTGLIFENLNIELTSGTGHRYGIALNASSATIRRCYVYLTASGMGIQTEGLAISASSTAAKTVDIYNSHFYAATGTTRKSGIFISQNDNTELLTVNLYNTTARGGFDGLELYNDTASNVVTVNCYSSFFYGLANDINNWKLGDEYATCNLYGCISATSTTTGPLTYNGNILTEDINISNDMLPTASGVSNLGEASLSFDTLYTNNIVSYGIKIGANQGAAGAAAGELWADSSADYVIKLGV